MRHLGGRAGQGTAAPSSASRRLLPPELRQALALAMLEDVLAALAATRGLAGGIARHGRSGGAASSRRATARALIEDGARDGHTGAVIGGGAAASPPRGARRC